MKQTQNESLDAFIANLIGKSVSAETFVFSDVEGETVRLVVTHNGIEIALDVEIPYSPEGCDIDYFDPHLTPETRDTLTVEGILPQNWLDAAQVASQIAFALVEAYKSLIVRTAREKFTQRVM